jgi:hypothetical protein
LTLTNTVVADNGVKTGTPGLARLTSGAGMTIQAATADIVHCTFANNQFLTEGKAGEAIMVQGSDGPTGVAGVANISYTIISNHVNYAWPGDTSALTVYESSEATLNYVLFYGNSNNTNVNNKPVGHGIINQSNILTPTDPIGYISPGAPNYNYHITSTSPAVDHAVGSTTPVDMDSQSRPYGPVSDIGADEYVLLSLLATPPSFSVMVDNDSEVSRSSKIDTPDPLADWTAKTTADWLYLGQSGTLKQFTGQSGDNLIIRFAPVFVGLGSYDAMIDISSPAGNPIAIDVHLLKVNSLYVIYDSLVMKH